MTLKNTADRWGGVSQLLHWTIVALIAWMAYLGLTMGDLPNGLEKIRTYALHKSLGLTILALVALRVLWRLYAGAPQPVPGTPSWQVRVASLTHAGIYLLLFAIPISGWVLNSAAGYPLQWFGLFNLPKIVASNRDLHEAAKQAHEIMFWALMLMVAAHAAAAFHHHFFLGDNTLRRMLPGKGQPAPPSAPTPPTA